MMARRIFINVKRDDKMDTITMRDWVQHAYPGQKWKDKVKQMKDSQIIALYFSLVKQGKIKN